MVKTESKPVSEKELEEESDIEDVIEKDGLNSVNVTPDDTNYDSETYVGKPAQKEEEKTPNNKSYIQQRKSYNMTNVDKNKLMNTRIGDHINYFDNGRQDSGIVTKMSSSFLTIVKEDGIVHDVHINDTFFVSDILVNKTWNDMDMEEKTEQLMKVHAYSPRYLSKTWEQLPTELRDVLKFDRKQFFNSSSSGDTDSSQGVKVGGKTIQPTKQRTFGHGSKVDHHDPNKNKPANTKTSDLKGILAEAQTSANMSNQGKGMSLKKVDRKLGAYKKNQALGQSIQGNVEKEDASSNTGDVGFNARYNTKKPHEPLGKTTSYKLKGAPEDTGNSWGIKYIKKGDKEE